MDEDLLIFRDVEPKVLQRFDVPLKIKLSRLTHHCEIIETGNESWRFKNRA